MLDQIAKFISEHQGTFTVIAMWIGKEIHAIWPQIVAAFPYCRANGGVYGIAKEFLVGVPVAPATLPTEPQKPSTTPPAS